MTIRAPYRKATADDAAALALFVNLAGEGMPLYLWEKMAQGSELSAWEIGEQRAKRDAGGFSYRNSVVREYAGSAVAGLIGYPLAIDLDPARFDGLPAMFVPLQELEDLGAGSWYVNVIATLESHQGRGYGKGLLEIAMQLASDAGCDGLSLIVADNNRGAQRLYERSGYKVIDTRPMVKEDWISGGENWVFMKHTF